MREWSKHYPDDPDAATLYAESYIAAVKVDPAFGFLHCDPSFQKAASGLRPDGHRGYGPM
jgi:hypothetical protein